MNPITGTVRNGKIEIPAPSGLIEGTEVLVWLERDSSAVDETDKMDASEIERVLLAMDEVRPFVMTEDERTQWQQAIEERVKFDQTTFDSRVRKLQSHWE
jgi:hypothetical protein